MRSCKSDFGLGMSFSKNFKRSDDEIVETISRGHCSLSISQWRPAYHNQKKAETDLRSKIREYDLTNDLCTNIDLWKAMALDN